MRKFIEKSIIAIFSLYATYMVSLEMDLVFYFLVSIVFSISLELLNDRRYKYLLYICFIGLILYDPSFLFYLPLILYDLYFDFKYYSLIPLSLLLLNFHPIIIILSLLAIYLAESTHRIEGVLRDSIRVRDKLKEDALYLKKYNEQLQVDKEKNIHIAILTERNRIAREIHDSIGHAISSSILQVRALKVTSKEDLIEPLDLLQATLNKGMNDIRKSLQGLRDESLDLKSEIEILTDDIPSLYISLFYNLEDNLAYQLKFDILSIIKESLTNTIKHSDASHLRISLFDQPKFYSIVIEDNGSKAPSFGDRGIGLDYINETANKYNGLFNYKYDNGFKIHLTLMKGD